MFMYYFLGMWYKVNIIFLYMYYFFYVYIVDKVIEG